MRTELLIIDPQNDFCDLPAGWRPVNPASGQTQAPALPVAGAHADMTRLAALVERAHAQIDAITVTLDSHHRLDIAHPTFWRQGDGTPVTPFTPITAAQVRAGQFQPRHAAALPRTLAYLDELERRGRYTLMVWPVHCEIGTWGHAIHAGLQASLAAWADAKLTIVHTVNKGENPWTEHYSALQAEVPEEGDAHTALNTALLARLDQADRIWIAGEASSHCVRASTEHIVAHLPSRNTAKITLLTDCMSPVGGFEAQADEFLRNMAAQGVQLATSATLL